MNFSEKFMGESFEAKENRAVDFSALAARFENLPDEREREFAEVLLDIARDLCGKPEQK
jgi:hypothetical protein